MAPTREEIAEAVRLLQAELDANSDDIRKVLDDFDADARRARLEEMETKKREAAERRVARLATLGAKPTPARIHAILKAAGLTKSEYHASGRVRGWGSSTTGYELVTDSETTYYCRMCGSANAHKTDCWYMRNGKSPTWRQKSERSGKFFLRWNESSSIMHRCDERCDERRKATMTKAITVLVAAGYSVAEEPRFDYKDGERTLRPSGRFLVEVAA